MTSNHPFAARAIPASRARWHLRQLADKAVALKLVPAIAIALWNMATTICKLWWDTATPGCIIHGWRCQRCAPPWVMQELGSEAQQVFDQALSR